MAKPKQPSRRQVTLIKLRVAGYHDDQAAFTRILIEERVSRDVAKLHFLNGRNQRAAGVRCDCHDCKRPS